MGAGVAAVAEALGQPLMPWQRYVADVAGEVDDRGLYVYPLVIVSVPRQSGKTTLALAQAIHRCLQGPNRRAWFTAQTGQDASDKFRELVGLVMASPRLREVVQGRPRLQNGSMALTFVNGSTLRPHPPTRDALHGKQSDHNDVDEGWSFDEPTGSDILQAITPTQNTRPGAQTWVWSTRGDASSVWFHDMVARGLAGEPGVACFDWGIPDDAPVTVDAVAAHHPALGHISTRESLEAARVVMGDKPAEYARAYGNRATGGRERVIPEDAWTAARLPEGEELPAGRPAYGVAVWEPRTGGDVTGALVAAVPGPDGVPVVEVIETRPGRAWLIDRVQGLRDKGQGVAVVRNGPAGPVADALELAGVELLTVSPMDYAVACQDLWDRLCDEDARAEEPDDDQGPCGFGPRVWHRDSEELDRAAEVAGRRFIGEGAWVWSPKASTGNTAALEAMTLAVRAAAHAPEPLKVGRSMFLT
jgi:hypothetical protein